MNLSLRALTTFLSGVLVASISAAEASDGTWQCADCGGARAKFATVSGVDAHRGFNHGDHVVVLQNDGYGAAGVLLRPVYEPGAMTLDRIDIVFRTTLKRPKDASIVLVFFDVVKSETIFKVKLGASARRLSKNSKFQIQTIKLTQLEPVKGLALKHVTFSLEGKGTVIIGDTKIRTASHVMHPSEIGRKISCSSLDLTSSESN